MEGATPEVPLDVVVDMQVVRACVPGLATARPTV